LIIALRRLARRPSFTIPAIATLAVGVGATTAIFSALNAALITPLPYLDADDVYLIRVARVDGSWANGELTNAELMAIASGAPSVTAVAGARHPDPQVIVADDGRNQQIDIATVTDGFFDLAGVPLVAGGGYAIEGREDSYGAVVLSYRIWDQMFDRDPEVLGTALHFPGASSTIVGVAPPDFDLPAGVDAWAVFAPSPASEFNVYTGYLRVRPGTDPEQLRSELAAVMAGRVEDGLDAGGQVFDVTPLIETIVGDLGPILWIVLAAATVLLALACANVAALILARGGAQTREFAIRKALGASPASVSRQLLTESFLLSALGTGIGVFVAWVSIHSLARFGAEGLPRLDRMSFDMNVLIVALVTLIVTATLVACLPIVRLTRLDIRSLLGEYGRTLTGERGPRSVLSGIIVAEIAMAVLLVASAGWLVRSYANLADTDPGFVPESRLVFRTALLGTSYAPIRRIVHNESGVFVYGEEGGSMMPEVWLRDLTSRLEGLEGVAAVGIGGLIPFAREPTMSTKFVAVPGVPADLTTANTARFRLVSPTFFDAMGTRLLAGRALENGDDFTTVVVNEAFVRAYLGDRDPIGVTFATRNQPGDAFALERTIVGVVADVRYSSLREPDPPAIYVHAYLSEGFVVVSTTLADPTPFIPAVRAAVAAISPEVPVTIELLEDVMATELARHRLGFLLMTLFAAVSLALAGVGIHGVVGHAASLRRAEFAVRIAVGASPSRVAASVLVQGATLCAVGLAIGLGLAYAAGRIGSSWLYDVRATDPTILGVAICAVSALALAAFVSSALKGARIDPGSALKAD
jgi:predicted permease